MVIFSYVSMVIFSDVTEKNCVKDRYPTLDNNSSNSAKLRGHVSST